MGHLNLDRRLAQLVDELADAGITAGLDPATLTPPCVWVSVDGIGPHTLAGVVITARLDLMVPDVGFPQVYRHLGELAEELASFGVDLVNPITNQAGQTIGWFSTLELDPQE